MTPAYSLYFHIPFCTHRCAYCDFNTYAGQEEWIPAYVDALCTEVETVGIHAERSGRFSPSAVEVPLQVHTIFFGGGTPSLLAPGQFDMIFRSIRSTFTLVEDAEITIEANPGTVSYDSLLDLRRIGINRISYGVQSANPNELRMLERIHSFFDVIEAVASARKAGFDNLNLDLIYGLPEQTLPAWQNTVRRILDLHPEHISAYALTLEHGTPFGRWATKGLLSIPDSDLAAEMYEWLSEMLDSNGYVQYEISNWAKQQAKSERQQGDPNLSFACRHNLQYWRGLPYMAFGAGAHGYANGYRYSNVLRIKSYIERITNHPAITYNFPLTPATVNHHKQSLRDDMSEFMIIGLRLTRDGVRNADFEARFGRSVHEVYGKEIDELLRLGLIENVEAGDSHSPILRITKHGRLLGNQVFMRFVD